MPIGRAVVRVGGVFVMSGVLTLEAILREGKAHVPTDPYRPHRAFTVNQFHPNATDAEWIGGLRAR